MVPTRNRPDHAAACVESIRRCDDDRFTITVVDQSDDFLTRELIEALGDKRVRYLLCDMRGAAAARNVGAAETEGEFVAFTDDDCRVDAGWVRELRTALADPVVGLVFGRVVKGETDDPTAAAAEFAPAAPAVHASLPPVSEPWGISASVALRRSVFEQVNGFDTRLGPGAPINTGGEDSDLFIRVLAVGHRVATVNTTTVIHLGFRSGAEASALYRGYAFALGAVFMKHLRLGTKPGREQLPKWLLHFALQTVRNVARRHRPSGAGFAIGLLRGAGHAAVLPLDRASGRFA